MKKFLLVIEGILPFFAALFIQGTVYDIIKEAYLAALGSSNLSGEAQYYISLIAVVVCGIVFYLWFLKYTALRLKVRLKDILSVRRIVLFIMLGIGCQFFISGIMSIVRPIFEKLFSDYDQTINSIFTAKIFVVIIYVAIIAPCVEELIFRGMILNKLCLALPYTGANILQAAIFGIYHWNIVQGIYAFCIGLIFGFVYRKSKSIITPILLHMCINSASFLTLLVPDTKMMYYSAVLLGGALSVISLILIVKVYNNNLK